MDKSPTQVIFLWHMHQPSYRLPDGQYLLPWLRFHSVKDYYGMAKTLEKFEKARAVFNFSGILLEQLKEYSTGKVDDYYARLTLKDPKYLNKEEKDFIVKRFFSINLERFVKPHRRYLKLYQKSISPNPKFSHKDILDLQVLFNLCWFHPYTIKKDKNLAHIINKKKDYNQEDKTYIINKQNQIISQILPLYKRLFEHGKIELSLTPYAHPIMPLVYDTNVLKDFPYLKKPLLRYSSPQDCLYHLNKSKDLFQEVFGVIPSGSWPSEGGISKDIAQVYRKEGFSWIGLDEEILFKSLATKAESPEMIKTKRHIIYQPYKFKNLNIFFRDRNLSDAISFVYQAWEDPVFAANDLLEHFKRIHYHTKDIFKQRVVTIIMDGENAWEYYKNNAVEFLETVYSALEKSHILSMTTPSAFLSNARAKNLSKLASGSWINADFGVWIGSKKNNLNWNILKKIKDLIDKCKDADNLDKIKNYFYIIQGSDWNWWNTFEDKYGDFKKIFLACIKEIFRLLKKKIPYYLK